ncbi:MAG TPA: PadR family transcriptional regulator [Thermoleophilaceae bacterium]
MNATYAISGFPPHQRGWRGAMRAMAGGGGHGRGRHRHGGGFPFFMGFGGPPFGPGGPGGPKARRGDVRTAALLLLNEGPRNGYQIMQDIEERSGGMWRPSPGSVYPALQQLEDEGLVRTTEADGRKQYELTDAGRAHVAERGEDVPPPWEEMTGGFSDEVKTAAGLMREVALAFSQVVRAGSPSQVAQASKILADTRRSLYRILAEGEGDEA